MTDPRKILVIRFSSFGDIVQSMSVTGPLKKEGWEIHFLTKSSFSEFVSFDPNIDRVFAYDSKTGIAGLWKTLSSLDGDYEIVYDSHNVMRSKLVLWVLFFKRMMGKMKSYRLIRRSKNRLKRFLLFKLRINQLPTPFRGMHSYLSPLSEVGIIPKKLDHSEWNFPDSMKDRVKELVPNGDYICLAPSAAWEMKRWPLDHWKELIRGLTIPHVILGGPGDAFCEELAKENPELAINLAGKTSLAQSCYVVAHSKLLVSADTGLIHVSDLLGVKGISLIGPTAFGFPSLPQTKVLEVDLPCRPCTKDGRGGCSQEVYQKCMVDITVGMVRAEIDNR